MQQTSNRRRARERAMLFLFGIDFTKYKPEDAIERFWESHPSKVRVKEYAGTLIQGVCGHLTEIDKIISEALQHWSFERVGNVERAILRLAVWEIIYSPDVPRNVAINEAVELAKHFGADDAPRFVNGVLDRVKRAGAEHPGKQDSP